MKTATTPFSLRSIEFWTSCVSMPLLALQLLTEQAYVLVVAFIRSTVCVTGNRRALSEVEGISVLAGERAQGFGLHASSEHWRPCCSSTARVTMLDLPWLGRSEDLRRGACRWC